MRETVPVNWALLHISRPVCQQPCSLETKTRKQGRMCIQKVVFRLSCLVAIVVLLLQGQVVAQRSGWLRSDSSLVSATTE